MPTVRRKPPVRLGHGEADRAERGLANRLDVRTNAGTCFGGDVEQANQTLHNEH